MGEIHRKIDFVGKMDRTSVVLLRFLLASFLWRRLLEYYHVEKL